MTNEEIDNWVDFFRGKRKEGVDLDTTRVSELAWKIESFVATIDHLRTLGDALVAQGSQECEQLRKALDQALSNGVPPTLPDDRDVPPFGDSTVYFFGADEFAAPHDCPELAGYMRAKETQETT
jgi:hypothetical protein